MNEHSDMCATENAPPNTGVKCDCYLSEHKSDCAIFNGPAYPAGECDCGYES